MNDSGYCITDNVLGADECNTLLANLSQAGFLPGRAGVRHLMKNPTIVALASDPRLIGIAKLALGNSAIPFKATLFAKSEQTNWLVPWHQDRALPIEVPFESEEWGSWSTKAGIHYAHAPVWALNRIIALRIHLDDSNPDNGPLCVLPGSHQEGVLSEQQVLQAVQAGNHVECAVQRGGILAMRPLLIHASSKGQSGQLRRVVHIEYADALVLAPGIRLAIA